MLENFRLKVFRAVAEHLSFRKAGESLYLTQPAVTLQIKTLEEELGIKLFDRSATGVRLTAAGTILLQFAEDLHRIAQQAENHIAELRGRVSGELVIGASTTIAQYVLPPLLSEFARTFPEVQLRMFSENTEHIAEGVASTRFALGLIEGPPLRQDLKVQTWFGDELFLVAPQAHEWAGLSEIDAERLYSTALVMRERGSGSRHIVEAGLQKAGLRLGGLRIVMELDSTEAILSCVEEGLGIGFVSEWAVARRANRRSLTTFRIKDAAIRRDFLFVSLPNQELRGPAAFLLRFLQGRVPTLGHQSAAVRSNE